MDIIDWLSFGKVSAERDDDLSNYFFDNGVLDTVISSKSSSLVLGRKGAGKTAVFKHLTENPKMYVDEDSILIPLSFEDYNWNIHSLLADETKSESLLYKQSWKFVVLVECVRAYCNTLPQGEKPKELVTAGKLLEKIFDSPIPGIAKIVGRKLLSLSKLKLPSINIPLNAEIIDNIDVDTGEVSFDQIKNSKDLKQSLSENIENLIKTIEWSLQTIPKTYPKVFICFDRVDETWDDVSFETSKKVIAGLISAADSITYQFSGLIRPIVFLREDIFNTLSINDRNKLKEDCGALLKWDKKSLSNMILRRVNYFAKIHNQQQVTDLDTLFDKQEMRQRAKPTGHLLKRTMMRPRDLIAFLNKITDSIQDKRADPFAETVPNLPKIDSDSVYAAEPNYSEWLKQEILEEWSVQRPSIVDMLNAIQNLAKTNFSKSQLQAEYEKINRDTSAQDFDDFLRFLFNNSIIGFKLGGSNEWRFKCFYPSQGFIESDEYRIHEGLVRSLNLRETRD